MEGQVNDNGMHTGREKTEKRKKKNRIRFPLLAAAVLVLGTVAWRLLLYGGMAVPVSMQRREEEEFPVTITSCLLDGESGKIRMEFVIGKEIPGSSDGCYYLFALHPYEDEIPGDASYLRKLEMGEMAGVSTDSMKAESAETVMNMENILEKEAEIQVETDEIKSLLLRKFVVAVKKDGGYLAVSHPHYVTNPGEAAVFTFNGESPSTKKGLLIDPAKLLSTELDDLGVKHAAYNIPLSRILGHPEDDIYQAIHYTYNGKDYVFNGRVMAEYDLVFRTLTEKKIEITAILLNDYSEDYPWLVHPLSRSGIGKPPYYAFNASDREGAEYLAAIGTFLAERYSGAMNGRGVVANWVIGNEINARKEWNYMEHVDLETYVQEYVRAYRIFYHSIKSVNSACRVYISLDNQWNRVNLLTQSYRAKEVLDEFNRQIKQEGNIDWGLAIHPYNKPLSETETWKPSIYVKDTEDTPVVTMANLRVVTDYLRQQEFLDGNGEVRSITLSELGYTSSKGEEEQAAAMAYAYQVAAGNPYIDAILFSRQTDAAEEIERLHLYLGIDHVDGTHKYAYGVYRYMDTEQEGAYTEGVKALIGIGDWDEIMDK